MVIYLPGAQHLFGTRPLGGSELAYLATFPVMVWGVDEVYRAVRRRGAERHPQAVVPEPGRRSRGSDSA